MSIQSNINGILGTAAGAATAAKHLSNQKEANEIAKAVEQDKLKGQLKQDVQEYNKANTAQTKDDLKYLENMPKEQVDLIKKNLQLEGNENPTDTDIVNKSIRDQGDIIAQNKANAIFSTDNVYKEKAEKAFQEYTNQLETRRMLRYDMENRLNDLTNTMKSLYRVGGMD